MNDRCNKVSVISEYGKNRLLSNVQVLQGEILFREKAWASSSQPTEMSRSLELMIKMLDTADIQFMLSKQALLTTDDRYMISALMDEKGHHDNQNDLVNLYQLINLLSKQFQYQGVFPLASIIQHDCDPSTTCSILEDNITVKALKPLSKGEEVSFCYYGVQSTSCLKQRHSQFKERYGFDCDCASCKGSHRKNGIMNYNPFIDIDH